MAEAIWPKSVPFMAASPLVDWTGILTVVVCSSSAQYGCSMRKCGIAAYVESIEDLLQACVWEEKDA